MLIAKTLLSLEDTSRELWLYDSFQGFIGEQAKDDITWYGDSIKDRYPDFDGIAEIISCRPAIRGKSCTS